MKHWLKIHEREVLAALQHDLGKAPYESYVTELGLVYEEIDTCVRKLGRWARPRRVPTPLTVFHYHFHRLPIPLRRRAGALAMELPGAAHADPHG